MLEPARAIAFDFDGTLVDSAPGILRGLAQTLEQHGIKPALPLVRSLIGPPLPTTLGKVSGSDDPELIKTLIGDFLRIYDAGLCLDSPAFPGVGATLTQLHRRGLALYLVTNKRGAPTRKMLDHLGWIALFTAVYCLDENPECTGKGQLLAKVITAHALSAPDTPYVGDTDGDALAARTHAMPYIHVAWGYGEVPTPPPDWICNETGELLAVIGAALGASP